MGITFGTDGWRGVISQDLTFDNMEIVAQAYADYLEHQGTASKGIIVGYDGRFLSQEYAQRVAEVIAANGIKVWLTPKMTATPVISYSIKHLGLAGGVVVTASHNPPRYNGLKIKGPYGGSATPEIMQEVAKYLYKNPVKKGNFAQGITFYDADESYLNHIKYLINFKVIQDAKIKTAIDPMYGSGQGYIKKILESMSVPIYEIHNTFNPSFDGVNPEPIESNLMDLKEKVTREGCLVGLATDGDADRVGAVDADGTYVNAQQIYAIILWHQLLKGGVTGGIGKTFSTTQMIDKMAGKFGLQVIETPIGFKYLTTLFIQGKLYMGGEESGGIGLSLHLPERDGIFNSLLLLEAMAWHGKTLGQLLEDIMDEIGPHYYHRIDVPLGDKDPLKVLQSIRNLRGFKSLKKQSCHVEELDGIKIIFNSSRWLLFRMSGTEPVIRIYAEAESEELMFQLVQIGEKLIEKS